MSTGNSTIKPRQILIFGTAEIAELAKFYFDHDSDFEVVGFVIDDKFMTSEFFEGLPVIPWSKVTELFPPKQYGMHVALSYKGLNKLREAKFNQCKRAGYQLVSYLSSKATFFEDLVHGQNCFVLENQNLQPRVRLGENVMLWSGNHIGHGSTIESHAYLASHVVVSGHVTVGERSFIGVNASVRDFITIGSDCFVGMGTTVTSHLNPNSVILPARSTTIDSSDPKAERLINATFGKFLND